LDLALWLDAADSDTIELSGSSVTNWMDKSGNDRHTGAATTAPTYVENVINGNNVVRFSGAAGCFFVLDYTLPANMSVDVRCVYSKPSLGGVNYQRVYSSGKTGFEDYSSDGIYLIPEFGGNGTLAGGPAMTSGSGVTTTNYFVQMRVGGAITGFSPFTGDIAELVITSAKLTTAEITYLETYLKGKWGL
jgi:hypothetical protein